MHIEDHTLTNSGSCFMRETAAVDWDCVCLHVHTGVCVPVCRRGAPGLHEFLCAWKCVLCVVMCVCVQRPVDGTYLFSMHLVYLCMLCVCAQVHAHRREVKERENSGQAFRLILFNHSMRCRYPPKISMGLLYLPSLGSIFFQSPHIWVPNGNQAQCLALLAFKTAL